MTLITRSIRTGILMVGGVLAASSTSQAQMTMSGTGRSLGGYGASTITSYYGGGGGGYLPYNGRGSGFVPYRGGVDAGMGAAPISRRVSGTPIGGVMMADTPIGGASLSGGMGMASRGAMGTRTAPRTFMPFGYEGGVGTRGGMSSMSAAGAGGVRRSPSGPGFGYPFRMPPSLTGSSSMSMP